MEIDFGVDIESCRTENEEASPGPVFCARLDGMFPEKVGELVSVDSSVKDGSGVNLGSNAKNDHKVYPENVQVIIKIDKMVERAVAADLAEKKIGKEKRKSTTAKKPPKPPRPPRGLSLDAADQKLIKEIAELAMIKRARIERMKALKKMKAGKATSSLSSSGSLFAMLFTILFCIVIVCQGMSSRMNSAVSFPSSLVVKAGTSNSSFIVAERHASLSPSDFNSTNSGSPNQVEHVAMLDTQN